MCVCIIWKATIAQSPLSRSSSGIERNNGRVWCSDGLSLRSELRYIYLVELDKYINTTPVINCIHLTIIV